MNFIFKYYVILKNLCDYFICYPKKIINHSIYANNRKIFYIDNLETIYYNFDTEKNKDLIIYCHGNRRNIFSKSLDNFINKIFLLKYDIVLFDYSGFGNSKININSFTESELINNTISVIKYFTINSNRSIILYGHSLGASIAISASLKYNKNIKQIYLEAPFYNLSTIIKIYYKNPLIKLFCQFISYLFRFKYRNDINIKNININIPIIFIHSINDSLIHFNNSIDLSNLIHNSYKIIYLTGTHGQPDYYNLCI